MFRILYRSARLWLLLVGFGHTGFVLRAYGFPKPHSPKPQNPKPPPKPGFCSLGFTCSGVTTLPVGFDSSKKVLSRATVQGLRFRV